MGGFVTEASNPPADQGGKSRPHVLLNCASSLDGKISAPDGSPMTFSDELDLRRVHGLRVQANAILVGVNTILNDDPSLKVNPDLTAVPPGKKLLRVVLDSAGRTPPASKVADGSAPTLIFHSPVVRPGIPHAELVQVALDEEGHLDLEAALAALHERGVRTLLVEGGGTVLRSFVRAGFVDEWTLYQAPVFVGGDGPSIWPGPPSGQGRRLHVEHVEPRGKGVLWTFRP